MAQVPYEHIEASTVIRIDGVRAFNPGDPVPVDTARRLGLLDGDDAPEIIPGEGQASSSDFADGAINVAPAADALPDSPAVIDGVTTPEGIAPKTSPAPAGTSTTTATPPQALAKAPKQGPSAVPTP